MSAACTWSGRLIEGAHIEASNGDLLCPQCGARVRRRKKRGQSAYVYPEHVAESATPRTDLLAERDASLAAQKILANAERWAWFEDHYLDSIDGMRVIEYLRSKSLRHGGVTACLDYLRSLGPA